MPCNVDIATQEILKLAEAADPDGARTMGVLTKPDLATEVATRDAVLDLVLGNRSNLKLGYYVKNRSADDKTSTLADRIQGEKAFFMTPPWTSISERCGIAALKERLRRLLMRISKEELPNVKGEIEERLRKCKASLEAMGPARADQNTQRQYLGHLAGRVQAISQAALNGYYAGEPIFTTNPNFKLITRIIELNERFADNFWTFGHTQTFGNAEPVEGEVLFDDSTFAGCSRSGGSSGHTCDEAEDDDKADDDVRRGLEPKGKYPELAGILPDEDYHCPAVVDIPIMTSIRSVYQSSRGPELGTVRPQTCLEEKKY